MAELYKHPLNYWCFKYFNKRATMYPRQDCVVRLARGNIYDPTGISTPNIGWPWQLELLTSYSHLILWPLFFYVFIIPAGEITVHMWGQSKAGPGAPGDAGSALCTTLPPLSPDTLNFPHLLRKLYINKLPHHYAYLLGTSWSDL